MKNNFAGLQRYLEQNVAVTLYLVLLLLLVPAMLLNILIEAIGGWSALAKLMIVGTVFFTGFTAGTVVTYYAAQRKWVRFIENRTLRLNGKRWETRNTKEDEKEF